jgi:hypothetical protein
MDLQVATAKQIGDRVFGSLISDYPVKEFGYGYAVLGLCKCYISIIIILSVIKN